MSHVSATTYVVVDSNEWIRHKWLGSPLGRTFVSLIKSNPSLRLAIPEILTMELDRHRAEWARKIVSDLKTAVDEVGVVTGNPLAGGIVSVTEEEVDVEIRKRLTGIVNRTVYPELSLAETRRALRRINERLPPNGVKNQQAKDSFLWESCVSLALDAEVFLVTGDGGFYKDCRTTSGLADSLASEQVVKEGRLRVLPSMSEAIKEFAPDSFAGDSVPIGTVDPQDLIEKASRTAFNQTAMALNLQPTISPRGVCTKYFRTDTPHVFTVSFTTFYDLSLADEGNGDLAVSGECTFNTRTGTVENITIESINTKIGQAPKWTRLNAGEGTTK